MLFRPDPGEIRCAISRGKSWFGGLDRGADGGVGDGSERLGLILLVAVKVDFADAVGAGLNGKGMDGGVRAEGTARKTFAGGARVGQDLAAGAKQHPTSTSQHPNRG
jgi:hypothetical protein